MIVKRYINGKPVLVTEIDVPIGPPPVQSTPTPVTKKAPEKSKVVSAPKPAPSKKKGCGCGAK